MAGRLADKAGSAFGRPSVGQDAAAFSDLAVPAHRA
jgi:hypothetical protein